MSRPVLESLEDRTLLALLVVNGDADENTRDSFLTLREAILVSNGELQVSQLSDGEKSHVAGDPLESDANLINFNINGGGEQTIQIQSELPTIEHPVFIDGISQPGYQNRPLITLAGQSAGEANGLVITAGGSTVQAVRISGFARDGIVLKIQGKNLVVSSVIGTDEPDTSELGNNDGIIIIDSANNTIGGLNPGDRNIISGNRQDGVAILDDPSTKNEVLGNFIGTDFSGTLNNGNGRNGVLLSSEEVPFVDNYATDNTVRANVISGNGRDGVQIYRGTKNTISNNTIGLPFFGDKPIPNGRDGVRIFEGSDNLIGNVIDPTSLDFPGNTISGNSASGIEILAEERSATGNLMRGNFIGIDSDSKLGSRDKLGNTFSGITISNSSHDPQVFVSGTIIGGADADDSADGMTNDGKVDFRNFISGNLQNGIFLEGPRIVDTIIQGNYIGTNKDGTQAIPNLGDGIAIKASPTDQRDNLGNIIWVGASGTLIGGIEALARNLISGNEGNGIDLGGFSTHTSVFGNWIGLTADGTHALGNRVDGIAIRSSENTIGGPTEAHRNVISASREANGIRIQPEPFDENGPPFPDPATRNLVSGNFIGTDKTGAAPDKMPNTGDELGNAFNGILIDSASDNTIGGFTDDDRNIIGGNGEDGVAIVDDSEDNHVTKNWIGVGLGNSKIPNRFGVLLTKADAKNDVKAPSGNFIGDVYTFIFEVSLGNVIGFNHLDGIQINSGATEVTDRATTNQIVGNFIGTDPTGTAVLGNDRNGVVILDSPSNTVGGTTDARGNLIMSNTGNGLLIQGQTASGNKVLGNKIGSAASVEQQANGVNGVFINDAPGNFIGTGEAGARNVISGNTGAGVLIDGEHATGNQVLGNDIGTTADGLHAAGNGAEGVRVQNNAAKNIIAPREIWLATSFRGMQPTASSSSRPAMAICSRTTTSGSTPQEWLRWEITGKEASVL